MEEIKLFQACDNSWLTNKSLFDSLKKLGTAECETLFLHTSLSFGKPNPGLKKKELLQELLEVIKALNVKNICMPTYTFSFCNGKDYDPTTSASKMGALNEYFRKQEGVIRSIDPLMSVAMLGDDTELVTNVGHSSCGNCSTYDKLRHRDNVKFLFLGAKIGDCFTYMHYLEWLYGVDYRYDRTFRGNIIRNGIFIPEEYTLFCRYNGATPNTNTYKYEQCMYEKGEALTCKFGDSSISIVEEKVAATEYLNFLQKDPHYFIDFDNGLFVKDKTYKPIGEVVAM